MVNIAKRYAKRGLTLQDLIQEGNLGLMHAADKFDVDKGFRFTTYATFWVRQSISRAISNQSRTIRVPVHTLDAATRLVKAANAYEQELGRAATVSELAVALDLPAERISHFMRVVSEPISLDGSVGEHGDSTLGEFIPDVRSHDPAARAVKSCVQGKIAEVLSTLTTIEERAVIELRVEASSMATPETLSRGGNRTWFDAGANQADREGQPNKAEVARAVARPTAVALGVKSAFN